MTEFKHLQALASCCTSSVLPRVCRKHTDPCTKIAFPVALELSAGVFAMLVAAVDARLVDISAVHCNNGLSYCCAGAAQHLGLAS